MRISLLIIAAVSFALLLPKSARAQQPANTSSPMATGIVYHDANANRKYDDGEKTLAGIKVSNGLEIVKTDEQGRYKLPVSDDTIIFVLKPKGWRTPLSKNKLPEFYYIHKPNGSPKQKFPGVAPTGPLPESIDFPLYPQEEPKQFKAIMFGDPQPRDQKEVDYIAHDVVEELIGTDASFGVTLGDIMFDDLSLFRSLNSAIALIGIPWYNVIGNHDINFDAKNDKHSDETFESVYGPSYYSFDYGNVHFLVLDDIEWYIPEPGKRGRYRGGFGKEQLTFIKNDLAMIPEDQLVVLMMHIPLTGVEDREKLYRLIEKRPFCMSISGHTHFHQHRYIKKEDGWLGPEPHHHVINVTVSGSWWSGKPDERGIPHTMMTDGAPNGYSIISFDGNKYNLTFKAAGKPADYQIRVTLPEAVSQKKLTETFLYANVFNGSEKTKVEFRTSHHKDWTEITRSEELDPTYVGLFMASKSPPAGAMWRALPTPRPSFHLWKTELPKDLPVGTHLIDVRATLQDGTIHTGRRVIRITK